MMTTVAPSFRRSLHHTLEQVVGSHAAWLFAGVWLVSVFVLTATGAFPAFGVGLGAAYLLFSLITVAVTEPQAHNPASDRRRLWLQVAIIGVFILLTAWSGLAFHGVVAENALPVWGPLVDLLQRLGGQWFGNDNYVTNPVTYVVLPLVCLLLAGARLPELGFRRGHRVGRVLLLWLSIPVLMWGYAMLAGQLTPGRLVARFVSNFMQNGFWEEFLFRGALQTRLRRLLGPAWALVLQALLFGVWHLGLGFSNTGHAGLLPAIASTVVYQAVVGLAFGVIFERTRNLLAPSVVHIVVNSLG